MREKFPTLDEVQVGISLLSMKLKSIECLALSAVTKISCSLVRICISFNGLPETQELNCHTVVPNRTNSAKLGRPVLNELSQGHHHFSRNV